MHPTPSEDPTTLSNDELLDMLRHLGTGRDTAPQLIDELRGRGKSINSIADDTGIPRTTLQRWAKKISGEDDQP